MAQKKESPLSKIPKLSNFDNPNLESISGMDATFLYTETDTSPMHIGSLAMIEGSLKFETFKKIIHSRLHTMPKFRKRLVYVPLSIDYPYWVDDPNFDIDLHINHIALPKPGDWKQLRAVASSILSEPLDQSRPLWSFTFIEGLDNVKEVPAGSVAILSKMHHVAVDGAGGVDIMNLMYRTTNEVEEIPEPKPYYPKPIPNELSLMLNSAMSFAKDPFKFPKLIGNTLAATLKAGFMTRAQKVDLPTAPFTAPKTPLNGVISARRKWDASILSLDRVKALKNIMECTLNDVLLGICAGALRRYLDEKNKLPAKPLVAMVPVSTRNKGANGKGSNQISNMLIQLATNVADPIERLETIHENTIRGKTYQNALGAKTLADMAEVVPFGVANQAARLYSRFHLSEMHNPAFNVTITNVPGPPIPLYINGHKLVNVMGTAPVIDGMGLIIVIFSYDGKITVSSTSDAKSMPDLKTFNKYIRESANELESLILAQGKKKKKKIAKPKAEKAESDALFAHLKKYLKENAQHIKPNNGLIQIMVTGPAPTAWKIDLNKSPGMVRRGKAAKPDVTLTVNDAHLMRIARGKLNLQTAFIQGRLKIEGDSARAMKLGSILARVPNLE